MGKRVAESLTPHRRQFVVGPAPVRAGAAWVTRDLGSRLWLSHCPALRCGWTTDASGHTWAVLGMAVESVAERPDPLTQLAALEGDVRSLSYDGWTGRWVLIGRGELHPDAAAQLGCFYAIDASGRGWASSSPTLLETVLDRSLPASALDARRLRYEVGIGWYPPPRARLSAMCRLLPSQILDVESGRPRARPLLPPFATCAPDDTLDLLAGAFTTAVRRLVAMDERPPWLSLSAGFDSRVVLAAARAASVDVRTFTRVAPRTSLADRLLPVALARAAGYEHTLLAVGGPGTVQPPLELRQRVIATHGAGYVCDADAAPLLDGVRDHLSGTCLGGWCFEVGKAPNRAFPADGPARPREAARAIARARGEPRGSSAVGGLAEWLAWVAETPHQGYDWRDRYQIEQRLAGWQSSKEQLYDLGIHERVSIANSARTYGLMLSLDEGWRTASRYQVELVRRLAPDLATFPYNPADSSFGWARAAGTRLRHPAEVYRRAAAAARRVVSGRLGWWVGAPRDPVDG